MGVVKVWRYNVSLTLHRLTTLFVPSQSAIPLMRYDFFTFSKFDLENPRSRSWTRWTLKVTTWVQHSIDSHPFRPMSIGGPIPEIRLFQNLTLKIQGHGHGWDQSWKTQSGCNILSTHNPFVPCQSAIPFLRYSILKFDPENPRSMSWGTWALKVTTWVQHSHGSIDSHPFNTMSIGHPIPDIWLFQNLISNIQGQGHGWGERWKSRSGCNILSTHITFVPVNWPLHS